MTSQQILNADLLDILFEKRNKEYGAYRLRKSYPAELGKALGITAGLVLLLLFFGGPSATRIATISVKDSIVLTQVNLPEKKVDLPKPKQLPAAAPKPVQQSQLLEKIKPVETTVNTVATQEKLAVSVVGSTTVDGPPAIGVQPPTLPASGGTGTSAEPVIEKKDPPLPSRAPQFPGGTAAWLRFLERNLAPPADLESGEKRSVLVRFSVDEEGVVTHFVVVQSGGTDFDNEVIRALKKMPRWLPAIQQGKPVAVSFTQPVTFQGQVAPAP